MLTVKYVNDFVHPYMHECSVGHGLWTEVKERVDYREEGSRKSFRNVGRVGVRPLSR